MSRIVAASGDPAVARLLAGHSQVDLVPGGPSQGVAFSQGPWHREVRVGDPSVELKGLLEIIDNNPLVCADVVSVPSVAATLVSIALGPLAAAGLIAETPTAVLSVPADAEEIGAFLAPLGWQGGILVQTEPQELRSVVAATVMVAVPTPEDLDDLDAVFEERYDRSFFVRRDEASVWDLNLVEGQPYACYRLRISPDAPNSLLSIRVIADLNGKVGAAQLIHAMNVMAGLEESLGTF